MDYPLWVLFLGLMVVAYLVGRLHNVLAYRTGCRAGYSFLLSDRGSKQTQAILRGWFPEVDDAEAMNWRSAAIRHADAQLVQKRRKSVEQEMAYLDGGSLDGRSAVR